MTQSEYDDINIWNNKYHCKNIVAKTEEIVIKKISAPFFLILFLLCGCGSAPSDYQEFDQLSKQIFFSQDAEELKQEGFTKIDWRYSSEISLCLQNKKNEKKLILFASPKFFYDEQERLNLIDTGLQKSFRNDYLYETAVSDIKTFFPGNMNKTDILVKSDIFIREASAEENNRRRCDFSYHWNLDFANGERVKAKSFNGEELDVIQYKNNPKENLILSCYPTTLGVSNDIQIMDQAISEIDFTFLSSNIELQLTGGGYILLSQKDKQILGVIQPPALRKENSVSVNSYYSVKKNENGEYRITVHLDQAFLNSSEIPAILNVCMDINKTNQADSQVYSQKPELNTYLRNYALLGSDNIYGECENYLRFQFWNRFGIEPEDVDSIRYKTFFLNQSTEKNEIEVSSVLEDWCSLTLDWKTKAQSGDVIQRINRRNEAESNRLIIDLTNCKNWVPDEALQRQGVVLKNKGPANIIATNDNVLFPAYTEIVFHE